MKTMYDFQNKFSFFISEFEDKSIITVPKIASRHLTNMSHNMNGTYYNVEITNFDLKQKRWDIKIKSSDNVNLNVDLFYKILSKVNYFIMRNPYERALSGFLQIFHYNLFSNELVTDNNYIPFWDGFSYKSDNKSDLNILFNPDSNRIKSNRLNMDIFSQLKISDEWFKNWSIHFNDVILYGIENGYLKDFLLNEGHCSPYLISYEKIINGYPLENNKKNLKFYNMDYVDDLIGRITDNNFSKIQDTLGVLKNIDDSLFKQFFNTIEEFKSEELIYNKLNEKNSLY